MLRVIVPCSFDKTDETVYGGMAESPVSASKLLFGQVIERIFTPYHKQMAVDPSEGNLSVILGWDDSDIFQVVDIEACLRHVLKT